MHRADAKAAQLSELAVRSACSAQPDELAGHVLGGLAPWAIGFKPLALARPIAAWADASLAVRLHKEGTTQIGLNFALIAFKL